MGWLPRDSRSVTTLWERLQPRFLAGAAVGGNRDQGRSDKHTGDRTQDRPLVPTEQACEWGSGRPALAAVLKGVALKTKTAQEVAGERRISF